MRDKLPSIFLIVLFGILNIAVLILAWLRPMPGSERILATFIGSFGLLVVLIRSLLFKSLRVKTDAEQVMVEAEVKDKP